MIKSISNGAYTYRLAGESSPEEHVEYLLRGHVRLEAVRGVVLVETAPASPVVVVVPPAVAVGHLRAVQVVLSPLLRVREHREGVSDGLEGLGRAGSLVLVGVELQGQLAVRLLQLALPGVLAHAQHLVVVLTSAYPEMKQKISKNINKMTQNALLIPLDASQLF